MKIIVASDSFKGCMSSKEVEESIKKGILKANDAHEVLTFPMLMVEKVPPWYFAILSKER